MRVTLMLGAMALALGGASLAHEHDHPAQQAANPQWDKMKTLVGNWEGTADEGGKKQPATTYFRMVSAGSALMNVLGEGTPHEMITMIHLDLKELMATHYCAAQNQPRMKAVPAAANEVAFDFKDGTNIGPNDGHMQRVVFTFVDADHHFQDWTFRDKGKDSTMRFEFKRKR
ncbi:MAG TPA: hypothetical protein VFF06_20345 [Polyangia bacterium]|nr:hypothetical protein [Polyangia bacterium]